MKLTSLKGCRLTIGSYPTFSYNASDGGGQGTLIASQNNIFYLSFSSKTFYIPPLTYKNTKFLSIPLPPGLKIKMHMDKLEGTVDKSSGEVLFQLEAKFIFSILTIIKFPYLLVNTTLSTEKIKGNSHAAKGFILQKNGKMKLVGISIIPPTGNKVLDTFLNLPNEAIAELKCEIK